MSEDEVRTQGTPGRNGSGRRNGSASPNGSGDPDGSGKLNGSGRPVRERRHLPGRWLRSPGLQAGSALVVFTLVAAVSATQLHLNWTAAGFEPYYPTLLGVELVEWWIWAATVPLIVVVHRTLTRRSPPWMGIVLAHVGIATAVFAVQNGALVLLTPIADPASTQASFVEAYLSRGLLRLTSGWVVYAFVLGAVWLLHETERRHRLTRDLYDAQLRALRAQIHPHFLFNTLHAAGSLIRSGDRDESIRVLVALSELLRRSLEHARLDEVPLEEELDFLEIYLSIQRVRFGEQLRVDIDVDPGLLRSRIPPLTLQPLVENAIRHGLDLGTEPGTIAVTAREERGMLRVVVQDSGGRLDPDAVSSNGGIGVSNLEDRLSCLYGDRQSLSLRRTAVGTTAVTVELPAYR